MKKLLPFIFLWALFGTQGLSQVRSIDDMKKEIREEMNKEWPFFVEEYANEKNVDPKAFPKKMPEKVRKTINAFSAEELDSFLKETSKRSRRMNVIFKGYLDTQYAVEVGKAPAFYGDQKPPILIERKDAPKRQLSIQGQESEKIGEERPWWEKNLLYISLGGFFVLVIIWDQIKKKGS